MMMFFYVWCGGICESWGGQILLMMNSSEIVELFGLPTKYGQTPFLELHDSQLGSYVVEAFWPLTQVCCLVLSSQPYLEINDSESNMAFSENLNFN